MNGRDTGTADIKTAAGGLPGGVDIAGAPLSPVWVKRLAASLDEAVGQIFVVAGHGMKKVTATASMHERGGDGVWKQVITAPAFVGERGLCPDAGHREGREHTPIGVYTFDLAFGVADDPGCAMPYIKADQNTWWSGDSRPGMNYNKMIDIRDFPDLDRTFSEHIVDHPVAYRYCLNISFNQNGTPGRGSAIFLHCYGDQGPATDGCVALPEPVMLAVIRRVRSGCAVVIDTAENLEAEHCRDHQMPQ